MTPATLHRFGIHHLSEENIIRHVRLHTEKALASLQQFEFKAAQDHLQDANLILTEHHADLLTQEKTPS